MNKPYKHNHAGHRQRLKNKFKRIGLRNFEDHEILELLLTYSIPRKDTNQIAHDLLNTFSSLDNVIDAELKELAKVNGVGEESAIFFNIISELFVIYRERLNKEKEILSTPEMCESYFRKRYEITQNEYMVVTCLNKVGRVVNNFYVYGENDTTVQIDVKSFAEKINSKNTESIVIFHTHPEGDILPSIEDIEATQRIKDICNILGVELRDHLILNRSSYFSFRAKNMFNIVKEFSKGSIINYKAVMEELERDEEN